MSSLHELADKIYKLKTDDFTTGTMAWIHTGGYE